MSSLPSQSEIAVSIIDGNTNYLAKRNKVKNSGRRDLLFITRPLPVADGRDDVRAAVDVVATNFNSKTACSFLDRTDFAR
jgi:hypothetical protein